MDNPFTIRGKIFDFSRAQNTFPFLMGERPSMGEILPQAYRKMGI